MVLTENGFKRPTFAELLSRQIDRAKQMWGEDIDTSGQSVLGKYLRINVYDLAECYELLEDIYYARFPNSARGQSLDRLCTFAGVVRDPATASRIYVEFTGKVGASIDAGMLIAAGNAIFYMDADYVIGADGTCKAYANCSEVGISGNIAMGTELSIEKPIADLSGIVLLELSERGQARESDTSLRVRFNQSVAGAGNATSDAILGAVSRVPLVDGASLVVNEEDTVVDGRPPHSFECYVLAPESQDQLIGEAIFEKKPLGIKSLGNVSISVKDKGNKLHVIHFSRTVRQEIQIKITLLANQFFELSGLEQIRENLMEYINNLANGESVYISSLYGPIHAVHGVLNVQSVTLCKKGSTASGDIMIGGQGIARIQSEDIEVEVV